MFQVHNLKDMGHARRYSGPHPADHSGAQEMNQKAGKAEESQKEEIELRKLSGIGRRGIGQGFEGQGSVNSYCTIMATVFDRRQKRSIVV
jgi:hypothetical protein